MLSLGYPIASNGITYRTIPFITEIISPIWYDNKVTSVVKTEDRPFVSICQQVLRDLCNVDHPAVYVDIHGMSHIVGATNSKQNGVEADLAIILVERFMTAGVPQSEIMLLTPYVAQ